MPAWMWCTLSKVNRWLIFVISTLLTLSYFVPLWFIHLKAPQYRGGLSLSIWVNNITGGNEFDLKNINLLNHYVGMKEIHLENFIEFKIMPYILGFMILGAVVTFFYPKLIMVALGLFFFIITSIAGLYDFHRLEYQYGRNLDPNAALSIPGISFEPPLLGCKAMMNFNTCSFPHVGGVLLILSGGILCYILFNEIQRYKKQRTKI